MSNNVENLALDPIYRHASHVAEGILESSPAYRTVIDEFRAALNRYRSDEQRMRFMDALRILVTEQINDHRPRCTSSKGQQHCNQEIRYAELITAIHDELNLINPAVSMRAIEQGFNQSQADTIMATLGKIMDELSRMKNDMGTIQVGQEVIYTDVVDLMEEMARKLPYGKQDWMALLKGRLASIAIDESVKRSLIDPAIASLEQTLNQ